MSLLEKVLKVRIQGRLLSTKRKRKGEYKADSTDHMDAMQVNLKKYSPADTEDIK